MVNIRIPPPGPRPVIEAVAAPPIRLSSSSNADVAGSSRLTDELERFKAEIRTMQEQQLEMLIENMKAHTQNVDAKLDDLTRRVDAKFEEVDSKFESMTSRLDSMEVQPSAQPDPITTTEQRSLTQLVTGTVRRRQALIISCCVIDDDEQFRTFTQRGNKDVSTPKQQPGDDPFGDYLRIPCSLDNLRPKIEGLLKPPAVWDDFKYYAASVKQQNEIIPCRLQVSGSNAWMINCRDWNTIGAGDEASILPFDKAHMELVKTREGAIPSGRLPVIAGRTKDGNPEYYIRYSFSDNGGTMLGALADGEVCPTPFNS